MSGLDNLKTRLEYAGGVKAEGRFQNDKLKTLKKALLYSYQAATAILSDGREFRCLINSDKLKSDYDNKIISIPYEDICLNKSRKGKTAEGIEKIGMKPGDVFEWKETGTKWLVYLEFLEEDSYFRAEIRKCEAEVEINNKKYPVYIRGPVETTIQWNQKKGDVWNNINYSLIIYITKNEETLDYFHRFTKVKIDGNMWEVKAVDPYGGDGIIEVCLGEWYNNSIEEEENKEPDAPTPEIDPDSAYIDGKNIVYPFDICVYNIKNAGGGRWSIDSKKAVITSQNPQTAKVRIASGKSGSFTLLYKRDGQDDISLPIEIESF